MNVALWPATLGYFLESMLTPLFDDADVEAHQIHTRLEGDLRAGGNAGENRAGNEKRYSRRHGGPPEYESNFTCYAPSQAFNRAMSAA